MNGVGVLVHMIPKSYKVSQGMILAISQASILLVGLRV